MSKPISYKEIIPCRKCVYFDVMYNFKLQAYKSKYQCTLHGFSISMNKTLTHNCSDAIYDNSKTKTQTQEKPKSYKVWGKKNL